MAGLLRPSGGAVTAIESVVRFGSGVRRRGGPRAALPRLEKTLQPDRPNTSGGLARWWRHPVVASTAVGAVGLGIQLAGYWAGWTGRAGALPAFYVGLIVMVTPSAWVLVGTKATTPQRLSAGLALALLLYLSYFLSSPLLATRFDETLHVATLMSLLRGQGLFAPNGLLPISPYYPGLELVTSSVHWLTGLPVVACQALVVAASRVLLVVTLFLLVERYVHSGRAAGLAVLAYCASTQFYFFNAQFAYQTLAIALFLGVILLVQWALDAEWSAPRTAAAVTTAAAALAFTHHVTSWAAVAVLWLWAAAHRLNHRQDRAKVVAVAATGATAVTGLWTILMAGRLIRYLGPLFRQAQSQLAGVLTGASASRRFFVDQNGYRTPMWEVAVIALSVVAWLVLLALAVRALRRDPVPAGGSRLRWLPAAVACTYPLLMAARVSPTASQVAERASTFVFFAVALVVAAWAATRLEARPGLAAAAKRLEARPRLAVAAKRLAWPRLAWPRLAAAGVAVLLVVGGLMLGSGPNWGLVPGPYYLAGAQQRSIDQTSISAARWAGEHMPRGSLFAADTAMSEIIPDYADAQPVTAESGRANVSPIYFTPTVDAQVISLIRRQHIDFVVVDTRLVGARARIGTLFEPTTADGYDHAILTAADAYKFAHAPGFQQVYAGPVEIFDVRSLLGVAAPLSQRSLTTQPDAFVWWQMPIALIELVAIAVIVVRRRPRAEMAIVGLLAIIVAAMALGAVGSTMSYPPLVGLAALTLVLGAFWATGRRRHEPVGPAATLLAWADEGHWGRLMTHDSTAEAGVLTEPGPTAPADGLPLPAAERGPRAAGSPAASSDGHAPTEVRPAEVRPAEVRPAEVRPAEVCPAEVCPAPPEQRRLARVAQAVTRAMPTEKPAGGRPPFYSAYVNRRLGYAVARAVNPTSITPNQLTVASAVLSLAAIGLLAEGRPSWPLGIGVAVILLAGYVLDSADGQLSRLRGTSSVLGEWLDHTVDCFKSVTLHLAVLLSLLQHTAFGHWILLLPAGFTVVSVVTYFGMILADQLRARAGDGVPPRPAPVPRWRRVAVIPTDYGALCFSFVLLGAPTAFVVVYGLLLVGNFLFLCWTEMKWWKEMIGIDRSRGSGT